MRAKCAAAPRARPAAAVMRGSCASRPALVLAITTLALVGCVSVPRPAPTVVSWPQRRARLQALDPFELSGRVAVASGTQGFSAHLDWRQQGTQSTVNLNGPLGLEGVRVVTDGQSLEVETSRGRKLSRAQARAELEAQLGFEPPLRSMRYWLLGVPDPADPSTDTVRADGRLAALQQNDWQIVYSAYMSAGGQWLPQRMTLTRGAVRVRLVVDRWQP